MSDVTDTPEGKLLSAAKAMVESYADHVDRCRACTINWQNLKAALQDVALAATDKPREDSSAPASAAFQTWLCGCGHTNGVNLEWCAMCYRRPNGKHKDE
jgi:hypothetical protein